MRNGKWKSDKTTGGENMALKREDLDYYKACIRTDKTEHDTAIDKVNDPEGVIAAYNGKFDGKDDANSSACMIENYLFVAAVTALPSLYYQLPRIQIQAKRKGLDFEAAVLTSLVNSDFDSRSKEENQLCIIDAFLPYGFAVIKNLYNSKTGKPKSSVLTGKTGESKANDGESEGEYIEFEKSVRLRQSPKKTYLDSTQPFGKGNRITFEYTRTLQQLIDSNMYQLSANFISYFKGHGEGDPRKADIKLTEHWCMKEGYAWKLCIVEGWAEEIAWVQTEYDELPVSYLRFNKMGDILYNVSHGTLGLRAQKELNYLNELWKKHIDNIRNQTLVHEASLTESGNKTLRNNEIGGVVTTKTPLTGSAAQALQSAQVDPALFGNIQAVRQYLSLIMSVTGAKSGGPAQELATTEKMQALGDSLRTSGVQDEIREFMVSQIKQTVKNYLKLASPNRILTLSGEGVINPMTGKPIPPGEEIKIGPTPGFQLKELITGDIDLDFAINIDITSAAKPDYPVIRKQLAEGMIVANQIEPKIASQGKKINWDLMLVDYFATFDTIPDAKKYISELSEEEKAKMAQAAMMAQGGLQGTAGSVLGAPEAGAIEQGAGAVKTGVEGLGL